MATADFILGTTCRSTARKSLGVWIAALATTVTLAGCSSQPETADIQKDLTEAYACPILELSEVKKVDGAANGKSYDVAFTHTVSIKGGAEAAAKLLEEEMEQVAHLSVPLTAEAHWGRNWLEAH